MAKSRRPPPQPSYTKCIFCGGKPLTETHIWPKWISGVLPYQRNFEATHDEPIMGTRQRIKHKVKIKKDIFSQQPRLACESCNGGWMKKFEDEVVTFLKPILSEMGPLKINKKQQKSLVGWICLIVMLAEWGGAGKHAITRHELRYIKKHRLPPDNWSVFVGGCDGVDWMKRYAYHNLTLLEDVDRLSFPLEADGFPARNTQISTIGIGNLLFQVFSATSAKAVHSYRITASETGMIKLWPQPFSFWPLPNRSVQLPPKVAFSDEDAYIIADAFKKRLRVLFERT